MKINIEKLFDESDGSIRVIEELHIQLPQELTDELDWEDGTLVEWERDEDSNKIILRNIEDESLDAEAKSLQEKVEKVTRKKK
tara:strand:+ start:207 stop:455 length:249 start_codon:yes stop_codon:yes gene_type:complete